MCEDVSDAEALDRFVDGLKPRIKDKVVMEYPQTLADAVSAAERASSVWKGSQNNPGTSDKRAPGGPGPSRDSGPVPMELGNMQGGNAG